MSKKTKITKMDSTIRSKLFSIDLQQVEFLIDPVDYTKIKTNYFILDSTSELFFLVMRSGPLSASVQTRVSKRRPNNTVRGAIYFRGHGQNWHICS